jgi:hypothetical protein
VDIKGFLNDDGSRRVGGLKSPLGLKRFVMSGKINEIGCDGAGSLGMLSGGRVSSERLNTDKNGR